MLEKSVLSYIVSLVVRGLVEGAELGTLGLGKEKEGPGNKNVSPEEEGAM